MSVCHTGHPMTQTVSSKNTTAAAFREGSEMCGEQKSALFFYIAPSIILKVGPVLPIQEIEKSHDKTKTNNKLNLLTHIDCVVKA